MNFLLQVAGYSSENIVENHLNARFSRNRSFPGPNFDQIKKLIMIPKIFGILTFCFLFGFSAVRLNVNLEKWQIGTFSSRTFLVWTFFVRTFYVATSEWCPVLPVSFAVRHRFIRDHTFTFYVHSHKGFFKKRNYIEDDFQGNVKERVACRLSVLEIV